MKSRYIPITQQPYCCVPACIQMVLYKNGLPLKSQEQIGNELGLRVKPEFATLFENVSTEEPETGVWGTQIGNPKYEINAAFQKMEIPLDVSIKHVKDIGSVDKLQKILKDVEQSNGDALLCFRYGALWGTDSPSGHVCVFDMVVNDEIQLVDPSQQVPKLRTVKIEKLYDAMEKHHKAVFPGVWIITKTIT